jgi:hypothetical protein
VECDASRHGIGASFNARRKGPSPLKAINLKERNLLKPIYEKKMLAILHVVKKLTPLPNRKTLQIKNRS